MLYIYIKNKIKNVSLLFILHHRYVSLKCHRTNYIFFQEIIKCICRGPGLRIALKSGAWARLPPSMVDQERRNLQAFDLADGVDILKAEEGNKTITTVSGEQA